MGKNTLPRGAGLPKIRPMLEYRDIRLLTPDEQSQRAEQLRVAQERTHQRILKELDNWDEWGHGGPGRKRICLPPEIARRVLADLEAGRSHGDIAIKYTALGYPISRRWLGRAIKDGRLMPMATADGQLWAIVGEMMGKKADASTGI